ncbi:MAG: hypothetical protein IT364_10330 [Candidatus Hydrogenedentes bacterium]|nr:hypothetical protein [Candidatus Hydrogenedentota bacterium]
MRLVKKEPAGMPAFLVKSIPGARNEFGSSAMCNGTNAGLRVSKDAIGSEELAATPKAVDSENGLRDSGYKGNVT